ncbi:MAG: hypothetical protein Q8T09_00740 [Candidatus Melainabacteria bacterium]|nr:hypothetical protein [Candidatus Melainabacteria bacterium]
MSQDYLRVYLAGTKLNKQAADELEQKLSIDPRDELSRLKLMGYYPGRAIWHRKDREKAMGHELWFVQNNPSHPELRFPHCSVVAGADQDLYEILKSAWMEHVTEDCKDITILSHAAAFFTMRHKELAIQLIERAREIEPSNNKLLRDLAGIYSLGLSGKHDEAWLRRAYEVHKELAEAEPEAIRQVAAFANIALMIGDVDTAKATAQKILAMHPAGYSPVMQDAHLVLGRVFLKQGNIELAKNELLASGDRPQFNLANELISIGETQVVCDHLWRSLPAWKVGKVQLLLWILQLRLGAKPKLRGTLLLSNWIGGYENHRPF